MRIIRDLRKASESVTEGADTVADAAESLRKGVDTATTAILIALAFSTAALVLAAYALTRDCPRVPMGSR